MKESKNNGRYNVYYFKRTVRDSGETLLVMLDCTSEIATAILVLMSTVGVFIVALLITFGLVVFFSGRMIQPEIENSYRQKEFITNASHELKTPLAVISANTEVIEMMNGKSEWTESTVNQVNRMSDLISQLVVLSKLEERDDLVLTDVDISAQAEKSVMSLRTVAETKGLIFQSDIEKDIHVNADENECDHAGDHHDLQCA